MAPNGQDKKTLLQRVMLLPESIWRLAIGGAFVLYAGQGLISANDRADERAVTERMAIRADISVLKIEISELEDTVNLQIIEQRSDRTQKDTYQFLTGEAINIINARISSIEARLNGQ